MIGGGGGVEKWRLKLTSATVEVEVEAELGNNFLEARYQNVPIKRKKDTCL